MKLELKTTKGTLNYNLAQTSRGVDVYKVQGGFFTSATRFIGHGHDVPAAILIARVDAGDSTVRTVHLRD